MDTLPPIEQPLPKDFGWAKNLPMKAPFQWLKLGWVDFWHRPGLSLAHGVAVFVISVGVVASLRMFEYDYILFPALSGFLIFAPVLALGLYEKSRRIALGLPLSLANMVLVRPRSRGQIVFTGVLLTLLALMWMRAAVILYALFFGLLPFSGLEDVFQVFLRTDSGLALLLVGTFVGGLFAAFSFAISASSLPMLLNEDSDALTAMGTSLAFVWHNLSVMIVWGVLIIVLSLISIGTAFLGFIIVFPVLGHATWHAYQAMRPPPDQESTASSKTKLQTAA